MDTIIVNFKLSIVNSAKPLNNNLSFCNAESYSLHTWGLEEDTAVTPA